MGNYRAKIIASVEHRQSNRLPVRIVIGVEKRQAGGYAVKYDELTQLDIIAKGLKVMDATASSLSMDNDIPLVVFNMNKPDNIVRVIEGENIGTTIKAEADEEKKGAH